MDSSQFHKKCLITGSEKLIPLKGYEKHFLVKSHPLGFVFSSKIPTQQELEHHYRGYSREDYVSPLTLKRYQELLDGFESYRKTNKLIDVGCGIGIFLGEAKKRGWEVYGTEFTDEAIEKCESLGISMKKGKLDPQWYDEGMFDIIVSTEVIEHINNPVEEVQNFHKILRRGGLFYFTTPNFNALERIFLKSQYNVIQYPEHLSYYTKKTINYLLTKNGFKKKKLLTSGLSLTRIKTSMGTNEGIYISPTSTDEKLRLQFEKKGLMNFLKSSINTFLNITALGNSLKGWYEKI